MLKNHPQIPSQLPHFSPPLPIAIGSVWDKGYRYGPALLRRDSRIEKNNDVNGNGYSYTIEFGQLDFRLGRWFSEFPVERALESDYVGFSVSSIVKVDPDGDSDYYTDDTEVKPHNVMSKSAGTITRHKKGETNTALNEKVFYETKAKEKPKD